MTRNLLIFLGTFLGGALIALVARAAMFQPHNDHEAEAPSGSNYAAMVSNTPATDHAGDANSGSTKTAPATKTAAPAADPHAGHKPSAAADKPAADGKPVNTVCAICGMDVDPSIPTAEYQGKTIGFGCRMCPPKFKADPDRYGPAYLRNEVL